LEVNKIQKRGGDGEPQKEKIFWRKNLKEEFGG